MNIELISMGSKFFSRHKYRLIFRCYSAKAHGLPTKGSIPMMQTHMRKNRQPIDGIKKIVAIASGKGGVGKSMICVNLALSMILKGYRIGILDADIFGPSIPKIMGLSGEPRITEKNKLIPHINHGLKVVSIGFLVPPDSAIIWRGLMVQKVLQQLLHDVEWGGLDILLIDMPPGTGDVPLTISQQIILDGAIIVSTPQDIALIDVIRGHNMFEKVNIPITGIIENMSNFVYPKCEHKEDIFGSGGVLREAKRLGIAVLGSINLTKRICDDADKGFPTVIADPQGSIASEFGKIAEKVLYKIDFH